MTDAHALQEAWGVRVAIVGDGSSRALAVIHDGDIEVLFRRAYREVEGLWPGFIVSRREAAAALRLRYAPDVVTGLLAEIDAALPP